MKNSASKVRVICDPNVSISYLLNGPDGGTIHRVVDTLLADNVVLLVPSHLLDEMARVSSENAFVSARVASHQAEHFIDVLRNIGERVEIPTPVANIGIRDRDDTYLIAGAIAGNATFLVTGDKDLLAIRDIVSDFQILTPAEFLAAFDRRSG